MTKLLYAMMILLAACSAPSASSSQPDALELRAAGGPYDYCDFFTCEPCPRTGCPPGGHEVSYCCNSALLCTQVADGTTCPEGEFKVVCNWGMTNEDGSFTCYDW